MSRLFVANERSLISISPGSTSRGISWPPRGPTAFAAPMTTVPMSARSRTIDPSSREKSALWTCTAALRKIARNGPEPSTLETTAWSSGLAWMSSDEP